MKLKDLVYGIVAASMIAPVAFGAFNPSTVQASTKGHAVSKKTAIKYSVKVTQKFKSEEYLKKMSFNKAVKSFNQAVGTVYKKGGSTVVYYGFGPSTSSIYHVSRYNDKIHVHVSVESNSNNGKGFQKVDNNYYKQYNIKRHYTFKVKKNKHHQKSHVNHANKVTSHDIKSKNYYGKKAIGYYGFKHANGFWDMNRDLSRYVVMDHNVFGFWQAGNGAAYKVKGNYVHFNQSLMTTKKKALIVKISKIAKYSNTHGGKSMLKEIKTMGTYKQLSEMTH